MTSNCLIILISYDIIIVVSTTKYLFQEEYIRENLPPPADVTIVKLELIRIKLLLEDSSNIVFAGEREKNMKTLAKLGITLTGCIAYINELTYKNYLSGPSDDRDTHEKKCVWEFGTVIQGIEVYIKIKHMVEDKLLVLSFHEAEKPLTFWFS